MRAHLFLRVRGGLGLLAAEVLAAVGVPPHFGRRRELEACERVHAPALAPLAVGRHVTLKHKMRRDGVGGVGVEVRLVRRRR